VRVDAGACSGVHEQRWLLRPCETGACAKRSALSAENPPYSAASSAAANPTPGGIGSWPETRLKDSPTTTCDTRYTSARSKSPRLHCFCAWLSSGRLSIFAYACSKRQHLRDQIFLRRLHIIAVGCTALQYSGKVFCFSGPSWERKKSLFRLEGYNSSQCPFWSKLAVTDSRKTLGLPFSAFGQ